MAAAGAGIVGRNAHQPVNAAFGLQPAIGIVPLHADGCRFQAGFFTRAFFHQFDIVAMTLRPAHIHAHQHLRPILAFGTPGTCMDFEEAVRLNPLHPTTVSAAPVWRRFSAGGRASPRLLRRSRYRPRLRPFRSVRRRRSDPVRGCGTPAATFLPGCVRADLLRAFLIVPEFGVFRFSIQFVETFRCLIGVKDASSAVPVTARSCQQGPAFQRAYLVLCFMGFDLPAYRQILAQLRDLYAV